MEKVEEIISIWIQNNKDFGSRNKSKSSKIDVKNPPLNKPVPKKTERQMSVLGLFILSMISIIFKIK